VIDILIGYGSSEYEHSSCSLTLIFLAGKVC
jgi:hypothetical protein